MKRVVILVGLFLVSVVLVACGNGNGEQENDGEVSADDVTVVTVGVAGAFQDQWYAVNDILAEENIQVELVPFSEWTIINTALADGEIDLNAFQNVLFLNNALEQNGYEITPLGYTFVTPMNLFAGGRADIAPNPERSSLVGYIEDGARIGLPSDATNMGRALKVLEAAGLIELDPAVGFFGTEADIVTFHVDIELYPAEANTLPSLLPDLDAAVLNAPQALTNDLSPAHDSIFREDAFNLEVTDLLRNVIVSRTEEADNPIFARIVEAYQSQAVADVFEQVFHNAFIPAWE